MSKEISRREFFKIAGGIAAGASFSSLTTSCASTPTLEKPTSQLTRNVIPETTSSEPTFSPTETPTVTPIPKPTNTLIPKPTFTPEQTPTAEVVVFPQTQITAELLKQGFANVGGAEETIDLSKITTQNAKEAQTLSWKTIEGYASLAWDEKISLEDLAKDEIKAAKAVVSLGSQAGVEGFYRPGEVLPQFKDLTLLRLAIDKLPGSQDFYDAKLSSFPQNLIIRKGSHLTVLGLWADESGRWATVATDEGFDREKSGIQPRDIPRQYLAVIPQDLPDNIEGLSLQRLLNANNYNYSNGVVENLGDTGKLYHQELNIIEPTLAKNLEKEAGALFMDQKPDGSWYENPIVPYPPSEEKSVHTVVQGETLSKIASQYGITTEEILKANPEITNPSKINVDQELTILIPGFTNYYGPTLTKDSRIVIFSPDQTSELAQVNYNEKTKQWQWEQKINFSSETTNDVCQNRNTNNEVILSVPIDAQDFSLSCESSASAMVAAYFKPEPPAGFSNWEEYFVKTIPLDCNPHKGFRGKIDGYLSTSCEAPNGYGVYAEPVAAALNKVGISAIVEYGVDYLGVAQAVKDGYPVIVWISGKSVEPEYETDPETGQKYPLLLGEHVWVVIGVSSDNKNFLINDPWQGRQYWSNNFPRWDVFEGMRVIVKGKNSTTAS